jgi:hypothetical protein
MFAGRIRESYEEKHGKVLHIDNFSYYPEDYEDKADALDLGIKEMVRQSKVLKGAAERAGFDTLHIKGKRYGTSANPAREVDFYITLRQ